MFEMRNLLPMCEEGKETPEMAGNLTAHHGSNTVPMQRAGELLAGNEIADDEFGRPSKMVGRKAL
jgi:hypothetical protein